MRRFSVKLIVGTICSFFATGCTTDVMQDTDLGAEAHYRQPAQRSVENDPLFASPALVRMRDRIQALEDSKNTPPPSE